MKTQIMKPQVILLVLAFIFSTATTSAQKGAIIVGGSLGWSSESSSNNWSGSSFKDKSYSTFSIAPSAIFMFGEKMGLGLSLGYDSHGGKEYGYTNANGNRYIDETTFISGSKFAITPSFRYVFAKMDKIILYGDLMMPISFGDGNTYRETYKSDGSLDVRDPKSDYSTNGFGIVIQPAIGYRLTNKVTVFANVFRMNLYSTESRDDKKGLVETITTSSGLINMIDPHLMIGVNYAF